MEAVTATRCGALINETATLLIRAAEQRARKGDKRHPRDLALDAISDCWRIGEKRYSWEDLASHCGVRGGDDAPIRLARVVESGDLPNGLAWRLIQNVLNGMPGDLVAAALGGPTPNWWREEFGKDVVPLYRLRPSGNRAEQEILSRVAEHLRIETEEEERACLTEISRIADLGDVAVSDADSERAECLVIAIHEFDIRHYGHREQQPPPVFPQSDAGAARLEAILARSPNVLPEQAERLRLLDQGIDPDIRAMGSGGPLTARIAHYGALTFSRAAVDRFNLSRFARCRLYFAKEGMRIGIEFLAGSLVEDGQEAPGNARRDRSMRRVYTTSNSAHIIITSLLGTYGVRAAPGIECPVSLDRDTTGKELVSVDLTPAIDAAARENAELVRRGATGAHRKKIRPN